MANNRTINRLLAAGTIVAVLGAALPVAQSQAQGQQSFGPNGQEPIQLVPQNAPQSVAAPAAVLPAAPEDNSVDIMVQPLTQLDPAGMGILTAEDGGFGANLWQESGFEVVTSLLTEAPRQNPSPTLRGLMRRVTLSTASSPRGQTRQPVTNTSPFLAARLGYLYDTGALRFVRAMYERLPSLMDNGELTRLQAEVALLAADETQACTLADEANRRHDDLFWLHLQALCRAAADDGEGADFAMDMARELGGSDRLLDAVIAHMALSEENRAARRPDLQQPETLAPLHVAAMRMAGLPVPPAFLNNAPSIVLHAIALDNSMPLALRLEAGNRAAGQGALASRTLGRLFDVARVDAAALATALQIPMEDRSPQANATLYQAAKAATDPALRVRYLDLMWQRGQQTGDPVGVAQQTYEIAQSITPAAGYRSQAATLSRMLIAGNDIDGAVSWYLILRNAAATRDASATTDLIGLWPLMQVAGATSRVPWSGEILQIWWQSQAIYPGAERVSRGLRVFTLLEALGRKIPANYWLELRSIAAANEVADQTGLSGASLSAQQLALMQGLREAAASKRLGESILWVAACLGEDGPAKTNPLLLAEIVRSLMSLGLVGEARGLALEALLANGQ
jgi:hypothetical protein